MGNLSHTTGNVGIGNALGSTIPGVLTVTDTTNTTKAAFGTNSAISLNFIQGGGDYMAIGYNLLHTGTSNTWNYAGSDKASLLRWHNGGFQFWGSPTVGSIGAAASLTNILTIGNDGDLRALAVSVLNSTASTTTTTGALVVAGGVGVVGALNVGAGVSLSGNLTVGDFGGATNVMTKLNNTGTATGSPAVGCAIPLCAITESSTEKSNTTPLPPGTWFVYLTATENDYVSGDEDTVVVMAKIWTVAVNTYLRFAPTSVNPSSTSNIGISYSRENNTGIRQEGTFTTMTGTTDAYFSGTAEYPLNTVISEAGDHRGIVAVTSNSPVKMLTGFAVRIA